MVINRAPGAFRHVIDEMNWRAVWHFPRRFPLGPHASRVVATAKGGMNLVNQRLPRRFPRRASLRHKVDMDLRQRDVRFWHKADIADPLSNVR